MTTLGCRVNHAETRALAGILLARGFLEADYGRPADIEVVHSCSVTHVAARKSRNALRRAIRRSGATTFLTGCYASTNPHESASLLDNPALSLAHEAPGHSSLVERFEREIDLWLEARSVRIGHAEKTLRSKPRSSSVNGVVDLPKDMTCVAASGHVRAELKIQDGCDAHCTFCIIPRIRPTLRSKRIHDAVGEARQLVELGHQEVVLTGIFIGAYGHETALRRKQVNPEREYLAELIDAVAQVPGLVRLRISSMEPMDITETLLDAMAANTPVVVPHLHLPLQSGSDRILQRMNRQYRAAEYLEMIDMVNAALTVSNTPGQSDLPPAITTDIICGFPGESERDFEQTVTIARRVQFLHMHVFPYSARVGTAAARWTDQFVDENTKKSRVTRMIRMEQEPFDGLSIRFRRKLLGRTVRMIVEQNDRMDSRFVTGRCDHYARIHITTKRPRGQLLNVRIEDVTPTRTIGVEVEPTVQLPILRDYPRHDPVAISRTV